METPWGISTGPGSSLAPGVTIINSCGLFLDRLWTYTMMEKRRKSLELQSQIKAGQRCQVTAAVFVLVVMKHTRMLVFHLSSVQNKAKMSGDCRCFVLVRPATPCAYLSPVISPDCSQRCQVTAAQEITHRCIIL
ncbi:hypothetical protein RRG08_057865 [Elysia crispata]|uniref:Uncharacterized protein n=1 Tax=Elysia crispata TaxID=231223 RepID=A0AAE0YNP8_9GAST|nr:hypothetical protein RRG08_057865 [Elysia crispata]